MAFILQKHKANIHIIVICLLLVAFSQSRSFSHRYTVHDFTRQKGWLYLGKTTFQSPTTQINLSLKLGYNVVKPESFLDLEVLAVPAQFWPFQVDNQCDIKRYDLQIYKVKSQKEISFKIMLSNQTRVYQKTKSVENVQPTTFYFVLKDCLSTFEKENPSTISDLKVNLQVKNSQKHFLLNEQHNNWSLPLFIVLSYIVLHYLGKDKDPSADTWTRRLVKISIWTGIISLMFRYADHLYYAYSSGAHSNLLETLSLVFESTSDTLIIFIMILLAFGWTIKFDYHQDFTLWLPVCLISYFLLIIVMVMNKSRDTYHTKYHVFDTFAGYIMIVLRVGFYGLFLYAARSTYRSQREKNVMVKKFLSQLTIFATAFLAYIPLCFVIIEYFELESRYQAMNVMLQISQLLLSIWVSILVGWSGSSYRKIVGTMVVNKLHKSA